MTRRVALLGKPLRRGHSVVMHNAAFAAAGIDGEYVLRELDREEVEGAVAEARGPGWQLGANKRCLEIGYVLAEE